MEETNLCPMVSFTFIVYNHFTNRHKAIFKKNIFKTLLQGILNFEVRIFEKYKSQKKNKNSFEIPWPSAIKCP